MLRALNPRLLRALPAPRRHIQTNSWTLPIAPGGVLKARIPTVATLRVRVADPEGGTGWNAARVALHVEPRSGGSPITEDEAVRVARGFGITVAADYEPGKNFLLLETTRESGPESLSRFLHFFRSWVGGPFRVNRPQYDSDVIVDVQLPGRFDLDLEVQDGVVDVGDTFKGNVKIFTEYADVKVNRLKSMYIDIESREGDVSAVSLQGNVSMRTHEGAVDLGKVQGPNFKLTTADGSVQARAVYADHTSVRTGDGDVLLGGAQGYTKVRTVRGSVEVAGVEGRLDVETDCGDVEAQLSSPDSVSLRSRTGDISIAAPPAVHAKVCLQSLSAPSVDPRFATSGRSDAKVQHTGAIDNISMRGWIGEKPLAEIGSEVKAPRTIFARAPSGDISLAPGEWGGFVQTVTKGAATRFPRWATAHPPPLDAAAESLASKSAPAS